MKTFVQIAVALIVAYIGFFIVDAAIVDAVMNWLAIELGDSIKIAEIIVWMITLAFTTSTIIMITIIIGSFIEKDVS